MPAKSGRHLLNVFVLTTLSRSFAILPFGKRIMASEELARHPWDFSPQENWVLYRSTTLVCQKDIAMPALAARVPFFIRLRVPLFTLERRLYSGRIRGCCDLRSPEQARLIR